jgi:catechol 2,3-dioxygenase-like lactoylglutathione lyase family enzyme
MQIDYIDHFAISVKNLQTSFDWYNKVFGFELFHKWNTTWMIHLGDMKIGLFERPRAIAIDDLDNKIAFQHLAFHVSPDAFIEAQIYLTTLGIPIVDGPEDTGVAYSIFFVDPDGLLLEITTYHGQNKEPMNLEAGGCATHKSSGAPGKQVIESS